MLWIEVRQRIKASFKRHKWNAAFCGESTITTCLPFGGSENDIEGFDEAVGLSGASPGHDTVEVAQDHFYDSLRVLHFGAISVGAPLLQHTADHLDLFTVENF